jgi:hypothetical protein
MKNSASDKYALLLRLNPIHWPVWKKYITPDQEYSVWFKIGRRKSEEIEPGIPVVVLGTHELGILAKGETGTGIEFRSDPDWDQASQGWQEEYKRPCNRVCVKVKGVKVPLAELNKYPTLEGLHKRRETTTWLNSEQYYEIISLIPKVQS